MYKDIEVVQVTAMNLVKARLIRLSWSTWRDCKVVAADTAMSSDPSDDNHDWNINRTTSYDGVNSKTKYRRNAALT